MTQECIKIPKNYFISKGSIEKPITLEITSKEASYKKANCWRIDNAINLIAEKLEALQKNKAQEMDCIMETRLKKTQSLLLLLKKKKISYCFLRQKTYDLIQ